MYQVSSTIYVTLFYWGITSNTKTIENREHFIPFITSNDFRRLCPFGFVMPTSKQKYHCFLILVQNFSACTSRIYSLIVSDTNFYQFGHTFSFEMAQTRSQECCRRTAVSQRNFLWRVVTGTLRWLSSLHCLLYFLAFDWLRPAVLFFLNWTVCLFVK